MNRVKWDGEKIEYLRKRYHQYGPTKLSKMFNRRFGENTNMKAIAQIAKKLGLTNPDLTDGYTVKELSELSGCPEVTIKARCRYGKLKHKIINYGKSRIIDFDDGDKLCEEYHRFLNHKEFGLMEGGEAARLIGYGGRTMINQLVRQGSIDGDKCFVSKAQVLEAVSQLKETGFVKVNWAKVKEKCRA